MTNDGKDTTAVLGKPEEKPQETRAVVQWNGEPITITFQDVKSLLCPPATDQEVAIFLKTCQSLNLNPFANECFLIKYDNRDKAAFVIAIDSYLKAAEANHQYDGCEAGIILKDSGGKLELREGAFLLDEDRPRLVGGWARVYRKDRKHPTYVAVNKTECVKLTREGKPTRFWTVEKQPWMLRKSALKRALVEAFPSLFAGTLATAEIAPDADYHATENELPPAFQNGDDPDWAQFWTKAKNELGVTKDEAHRLLGVDSVKELLDQGSTMEQIWVMLVGNLKLAQAPDTEPFPEPIDEETQPLFDDAEVESPIDWTWLRASLDELKWGWRNVVDWLVERYPDEATGNTPRQVIESLTREHQEGFVKEVQRRLNKQ